MQIVDALLYEASNQIMENGDDAQHSPHVAGASIDQKGPCDQVQVGSASIKPSKIASLP